MKKLLLLMLSTSMVVFGASINHRSKPRTHNRSQRAKIDFSTSLDKARKDLIHFADSTSNRELAQTLTDISKTLKKAKKNPASVNKEDVEYTFTAIEDITNKLDESHQQANLSDCEGDECKDLRKLLCKIRGIIEKCCKHLTKEIKEIKELINRKFPCAHSIKIDHVPFVITKPGKYCVTKDLTLPAGNTGPAITVAVSNVTINFANHSLTLIDPAAVGIFASEISELTIENDVIQASAVSTNIDSAAIHLIKCDKVNITNIFTLNTFFGIHLKRCTDVLVTNSRFKDHIGGANSFDTTSGSIQADSSRGVVVEESVFTGISRHESVNATNRSAQIIFRNDCHECRVSNCEFNDIETGIFAAHITGLTVENCSFEAAHNATFALIQLGRVPEAFTRDVIIRNSTFSTTGNVPGFVGIFGVNGRGLLLENCIITIEAATSPVTGEGHGVALGIANTTFYDDATIRNCVLSGENSVQLLIDSSNNSVVDNCQIANGDEVGIKINSATQIVIKNSEIFGNTIGIELTNLATNVALRSNTVTDNVSGIQVDLGADINHIQDNKVFGNFGDGINNAGGNSEIFFNVACHNTGTNCVGVDPSVVAPPGFSPVTNGMNICCNSTAPCAATCHPDL